MHTIQDIAKAAGVSAATVSRVINNSSYVSEKTRQVVEAAIKDLNYTPNRHAQNLRRGETHNLGIITTTLTGSVVDIVESFMKFAHEANYTTTLFNSYNNPKVELEALNRLKSKELDGIFIIYRANEWSVIESYLRYGPIVTLHYLDDNQIKIPSVYIDHYDGYQMILDDLWENGARSFVNVLSSQKGVNTQRRIKAYFDFCKKHHIEPHDIEPFLNMTDHRYGKKVLDLINKMDKKPDAIIANSDLVASGIIAEINRLGISMPEEGAVVGFDNQKISYLMNFTSVDYSIDEQGKNACRILLNDLEKNKHYQLTPLRFQLIKRASTK
ncbi:MAG: LacI family transcriptional regulator [Atopostipes suicloacalis]|nr:LacI family transcriptional regulator [Atopostipes suicloacalis]